ncbi:MAG: hypothetical protein R2697_05540 [Ilumatobacteraceae bacterium]
MFAPRRFIAASVAVLAVSTFAIADTTAAADDVYVVRSGDSLYGIAHSRRPGRVARVGERSDITSVIRRAAAWTILAGLRRPRRTPCRTPARPRLYTVVRRLARGSPPGTVVTLTALLTANGLPDSRASSPASA